MFDFSLFLNAFLTDFALPNGTPPKLPKSLKNRSWALQAPSWTPEAAQKLPGSHFEAFLEPFWGPFLDHFWQVGIISDPILELFLTPANPRVVLVLVTRLLPAASPSVSFRPLRPRFSGSAGARVSAYNYQPDYSARMRISR